MAYNFTATMAAFLGVSSFTFSVLTPSTSSGRTRLEDVTKRRLFFRHVHATPTCSLPPTESASPLKKDDEKKTPENVLKLYNTQTRSKEVFTTIEPDKVRFYTCGPTVYDFAHIGNFRAFLTYDVVKRWLIYSGYEVNHVMNLTDVDDKIITRMHKLGCTLEELTNKFAQAFFDDLNLLNIIPATQYPRATEYMDDIEKLIMDLRKKGSAYEQDGSTYFSVPSFPRYGQLLDLTNRSSEEYITSIDDRTKRDPRDFALWKAWKPTDGEVKWNSKSLGCGRPGWHIECSCMAMSILGEELDIHGGGIDLVFPHHENEAAQSEAFSGKKYSRFWLHNGFVNIDNEKMSKSLGNFKTLRDIVQNKRINARAFRYLVVSSQYRSALAFTDSSLKAARSTVIRLDTLRERLDAVKESTVAGEGIAAVVEKARRDFRAGMNDDLNTPRATAAMFSLVKKAEKMLKQDTMDSENAKLTLQCLDEFDAVFGINYVPAVEEIEEKEEDVESVPIPAEVSALLDERNAARKMKDYQLADSLRDRIISLGYAIVDTPSGASLERRVK